jgi:hypothetical protein
MPNIDFPCNATDGFNFTPAVQTIIGHLMSFQVGAGTAGKLAADLNINKPTDKSAVAVVGVLNDVNWMGDAGYSDPISLSAQVSVANQQAIQTLLQVGLEDSTCMFEFIVYKYDPNFKAYFICFEGSATAGTALNATLKRDPAGKLAWQVDAEPSCVQMPMNFQMSCTTVPQESAEQGLSYATANQKVVAKKWGRKVGAGA